MKLNIFNKSMARFFAMACLISLSACQPDEVSEGNGLTDNSLDAGFSSVQTDIPGNRYRFEANDGGGFIGDTWDFGGGASSSAPKAKVQEVFFADLGTYEVKHTTIGKGGQKVTSSQTIVVPTSDPVAGNMILGGQFETVTDQGNWTVLNISGEAVQFNFGAGVATFSGGGNYNSKAIYQTLDVIAGQDYIFDMHVDGTGSNETWFEVYVSPTAPTQGSDYSAGGKRLQLNTWAGCATSPFSGQLSAVGCGGDSLGSTVNFPASGTVYFLIKCGGNAVNTINVDNVTFRRKP